MKRTARFIAATAVAVSLFTTSASADNNVGTVTADALNVRTQPTTESASLGLLPYGSSVALYEQVGSWYKIDFMDQVGYIFGDYVKIKEEKEAQEQAKQEQAAQEAAAAARDAQINSLIDTAKSYIGTPYVYGGSTPSGFDCSGFVKYVYGQIGISLSRTSYTQANEGTYVAYEDLMPGDIVCFGSGSISHVGIYVGDGQFIQSPRTGYSVCIAPLSGGSYNGRFRFARRIIQ